MNLTKQQRATIHAMFGGLCAYCGSSLGNRWCADHVKPVLRESNYVLGKGFVATGKIGYPERDCIENMMPACAPCNINKSSLSVEQWRTELQNAAAVLTRNSGTFRHAVRFGLVSVSESVVIFHFEKKATK